MIRTSTVFACLFAVALSAAPAWAQPSDDALLNIAQPDFTLINLPTSLRLPRGGSAFRITHRFTRPLQCGDCDSSLASDFFGLDDGAVIGVELRYGLAPNLEIVVARARLERTIAIFGQYGLMRQSESRPLEIAAVFGVEGTNNLGMSASVGAPDGTSPAVGAIVTRLIGDRGALHVEPIWVNNTNLAADTGDDSTFMLGLGARIRISPNVYVVAELTPRLSGFKPGTTLGGFAIEKRAGGHLFQLNFSNHFGGGTFRQIAEGAPSQETWHAGFNITRKFY